jgi:Bacterial pre-peptidase C-terminal domain
MTIARFVHHAHPVLSSAALRWGCLLAILTTGVSAFAGSPIVQTIKPAGLQRGTEVELTLGGESLRDAVGILSQDQSIKLVEIVKADSKSLKMKVSVDASIEPGLYPFWLVTKSGVSNLRLLSVGAMPDVSETEPNSEFTKAQKTTLNSTVNGTIESEDIDYFQVDLKAGQRLNVEIEGIRLHWTLVNQFVLDPYIAILDSDQRELASSDDAALWKQDGFCSYKAAADGTYTVMIRDSSFLGHPSNQYRLHIGDYPRPLAIYPAGGKPGQKLTAQMIDVDGTSRSVDVQLPETVLDQFPVVSQTEQGLSPSPNFVRVADQTLVMESEPNDNFDQATPGSIPVAFHGAVGADKDTDYFVIEMKKGQKARVDVYGRRVLRSKLDPVISVYGPDKKSIGSSDDNQGNPDPFYQISAAANGPHYIRLIDHLQLGSPLHHYRIEVTPADPTVHLTPLELRRDEAWNTVVPQNGYGVMVLSATRLDHSNAVKVAVDGLPENVTATTYDLPANRTQIPIVFSANKDASLGASLVSVRGTEDAYKVHYRQETKLVLGQNRRPFWTYKMTQSPLVVTPPMPMELEVVAPKSPIVRQGSKSIKVRIKRSEGFKNTVSLRTSYNPPGIAINNALKFEKDATEIEIPVTANASAALGAWPLVFVARYGHDEGAMEVGTNPVMLDVQEHFFDFTFPNKSGEMGTETSIEIGLDIRRDLPGEAEVEIVGLPKGVTSKAAIQPVKPGQTSVVFPISIAADAKPGNHKTLACIGRIKTEGEAIVQTTGTGQLRVDKPLPSKKEAQALPKVEEPKKKDEKANSSS